MSKGLNGYVKTQQRKTSRSADLANFPRLRFNSLRPYYHKESIQNNLLHSPSEVIAEDFYSKALLDKILSSNSKTYDELIRHASNIKRNFKKFRVGRLLKDTLPRYDNVTPKKAIRCYLTQSQCRTLLIRALHLIFKQGIATNEQIYKIVSLVMKLLFSILPNQNPSVVECNWFYQLLRTEILLACKVPSKFRREFGKNCVIYLMNFCCNLLSHCFYITMGSKSGEFPVAMYQRGLWNKIQAYGFKYLSVRQGFEEIDVSSKGNKAKPINRLKLMPKTGGVRPIGVSIQSFGTQDLSNARIILNYLCEKHFPNNSRSSSLNHFRKEFPSLIKKSFVYYCTGDLLDCFNKIDYSVLSNFLSRISIDAVFYIATKIDLKKNPNHFAYGIGENKEEAELNLYKLCPEHRYNFVYFTKISGCDIRRIVRDYAIRPIVYFAGKYYRFCRGVLQGSPLSSILNDIYLLSVEKKLFGFYKHEKLIYRRYVDDYIFFSNDKNIVKSAIIKLLDGKIRLSTNISSRVVSIPRFGCTKISINFTDQSFKRFALNKSKFLPFCGSIVDSRHNLLMIDYDRYKNSHKYPSLGEKLVLSQRLCSVRKRLIKSAMYSVRFYLNQFVQSYTSIRECNRSRQKHRFLSFLFESVLVQKAIAFNLDPKKRQIRKFLHIQLKLISAKLNAKLNKVLTQ